MNKGFTLVELLVVIAIVAILSSVLLVALSPSQDLAKDSANKAEANQLVLLYNQALTKGGRAPQFCVPQQGGEEVKKIWINIANRFGISNFNPDVNITSSGRGGTFATISSSGTNVAHISCNYSNTPNKWAFYVIQLATDKYYCVDSKNRKKQTSEAQKTHIQNALNLPTDCPD